MDMERIEDAQTKKIGIDPSDSGILPYLNYVYEKIISIEFPTPAFLLNELRSRYASELAFYQEILNLDGALACSLLGIKEKAAKRFDELCDMMRRIVACHETRILFENSDIAELLTLRLEHLISNYDIQTFHAYQKLLKGCEGSIVILYLRVIGLPQHRIKVPGLGIERSQALFDYLKTQLADINRFLLDQSNNSQGTNKHKLSLIRKLISHKFELSDDDLDQIVMTNDRIGHFPLFTFIACLFSKVENRTQTIARRTINLIFNNPIEDLSDVALSLDLSRERVRQIRDACLKDLLNYPQIAVNADLLDGFSYQIQSDYDFKKIRAEENVNFSNEYISICISITNSTLSLIGNSRDALLKPLDLDLDSASHFLYLVPKSLHDIFNFDKFRDAIDDMIQEKRFYPYRDDLDFFVKNLLNQDIANEDFYAIVKECRQILLKGYPNYIINSQIVIPANARKTIPNLIEDILREFNRPMTAEEICTQLNQRYPDLDQVPSKIGPNALRNSNIIAVSRTSTYALTEWDSTEKRGGTIRDLVAEYLNSLFQPIAPLTDICEYVAQFRDEVKESSVKTNLLAEASNRFCLYYKGDTIYIGFSDYPFGEEYEQQEKRKNCRRSFKDSINILEDFIKEKGRFPYSSGVDEEEVRLSRFYIVAKANQRKGNLSDEDLAELERIDTNYGQFKFKKGRISWEDRFERFVKYITDKDRLPFHSSKEFAWYEETRNLYDAGELEPTRAQSFSYLIKIVDRMTSDSNK